MHFILELLSQILLLTDNFPQNVEQRYLVNIFLKNNIQEYFPYTVNSKFPKFVVKKSNS